MVRQFIFVGPAVLWILAFFVIPVGLMVLYSFWTTEDRTIITEFTLSNYLNFFNNPSLSTALINTFEVTILTTVVSILLAYPLAYIVAYRVPKHWQWVVLVAAVLPFWTSYLVRSYSWLLVLSPKGIINQILLATGLIEKAIPLGNSAGAVVLGYVHFFTMLLTLTIFVNLVQINPRYRAAAADLGASHATTFFKITLPLSIPGVAVGAFLTVVIASGDYITPTILGGGQDMLMSQAIVMQIGRHANYPLSSSLGIVLMAVMTLFFLTVARWIRMERV